MSRNFRLGIVFVAAALVLAVNDSTVVLAQKITIGTGQNNRDRDKDKNKNDNDDDDENNNNNKDNNNDNNNNQGNKNRSSRERNMEQVQQFFGQRDRNGQGQNQGQGKGQGQGDFNRFPGNDRNGQFRDDGQADMQGIFKPKDGGQNFRIGGWQGDRWQGSRSVNNWSQVLAGGKQPFSSQWYNDHPKAWKYDNNQANIWVTASLPGVYTWLNWGNVPQQYNINVGNARPFDLKNYGDWYPLGVFSLMSGNNDMGTRVVQLAIDRHGHIAGNYYDMITDSNYSISGDVRRQSQRATWALNKNKFIRFDASLYRLMQPYGYVTVSMPGGQQDWQFVRLEN